jgi:nitroreductase
MELPVETWYAAIKKRRSRRKFKREAIPEEKRKRLASICSNFRPFPEARAVFVDEPGDEIYKGFIGSYGKIENAPAYVAFIGDMDSPRVQEALGYTGESIILEATVLGLGTCWVGGFFRSEEVKNKISMASNEHVLAVTPVGVVEDSSSFQEKLITGFGYLHRRKNLHQLAGNIPDVKWMKIALEAARVAPSAVNRQPWRFVCTERSICVYPDKKRDKDKISRRLDCGIAMLHLELGARHAGVEGCWIFPPDRVACFTVDSDPES